MKRILLVGGPADGMVKTIDDGLTVLWANDAPPSRVCDTCGLDTKTLQRPAGRVRYVEVVFGEQRPLRVFKLESLQDDDVLHKMAGVYALHMEKDFA